jgi:nucleotide-binding universal stress UspA family protein
VSKIIVGIDQSERSKDAVALASVLARSSGAELELACAYPYDDVPARGANTGYRQYLREDAEAAIKQAQEGIADLPEVASRTNASVSPSRGIQLLAERDGASLIVIGSSHRSGVGRVLAGTTAERLLHGAPCPVAVAPNGFRYRPAGAIATVAVAFDRSPEASAALTGAVTIARALGARLRIVEVLDATWMGTPALMSGPGYVLSPSDTEKRARAKLEELAAGLPEEVRAEPVVVVGEPETTLAKQTEEVDLMVVGSRGYGPHRAVLLGSVSGRLVRDAACPVIVVPRGIEAPLEKLFASASGAQAV